MFFVIFPQLGAFKNWNPVSLNCEEVVRRVFLFIFPQLDFFLGFLAWQHVKSDFVGRHEKISFSGDGG